MYHFKQLLNIFLSDELEPLMLFLLAKTAIITITDVYFFETH